ncbi:MAG: hypothetical protein Q8S13_13655, partial [Dehalococcoidia bacterium]|nr:hypothetical protein [Dehalococcoidia bacterium]
MLLVGNRTAAGSETVSTIGLLIADDADARARFGLRSELYAMYRKYVAVDSGATIHAIAVTEAGAAASKTFTFATNSSAAGTVEISAHGEVFEATVENLDTPTVVAAAVVAAINAYDEGRLQVTAAAVAGVVTVTAAQTGLRGDYIIGSATNTRGVRMRMTRANLMTITAGGAVTSAANDDFTAAAAAMASDEFFYQALATSTTGGEAGGDLLGPLYAVTATDNGVGEWSDTINQQALPVNGKEQTFIVGSVGVPTQAIVGIAEDINSVWGKVVWQENSDWTPAMLAAHHLAVKRSAEVAHPSANIAGYTAGDGKIYQVPKPFLGADRPTKTELRSALNGGVSALSVTPT